MNAWASIIQTFQLSEHTQVVPMSSDSLASRCFFVCVTLARETRIRISKVHCIYFRTKTNILYVGMAALLVVCMLSFT